MQAPIINRKEATERGAKTHGMHFMSLFYLNVFNHISAMQGPIINRKEAMERGAKMHGMHCLKIPFYLFLYAVKL